MKKFPQRGGPILILLCSAALATGAVSSTSPFPAATAAPVVLPAPTPSLTLDAALRDEANQYRLYLTNLADQLKYIVGGLVLVGGVFLGALGWKSQSDITKQIEARFEATINKQLQARLQEFDRDIDQARNLTIENLYRVDRLVDNFGDFASALTLAFYLLNQRDKSGDEWELDRQRAIKDLQAVRKDLPDWRRVAILIGRLHKANKEFDKGIQVLSEVMQFRDQARMPRNTDYAALLFNRACYRNLAAESLAKEGSSPGEAESLRNNAWRDLLASIRLEPKNTSEALEDPDFDGLWNDTSRQKNRLETEAKAMTTGYPPFPALKTPSRVWLWLHKQKN